MNPDQLLALVLVIPAALWLIGHHRAERTRR